QAMKRFVDLQSSFALGDWVFEHHTVMVTGNGNLTDNFKGLCVGDVDCSYLPPNTKDEPALSLENQGVQLINPGQIVEIPLKAKEAMEFAALSLVMDYSPGIEIVAVEVPSENQNLVFHAENSQLRIAWYTLHPMMTAADERILTLKVRLTESGDSPFAETGFQINPESVLADFEGNPVLNKTLTIPSFVDGRNGFCLSQNRPNPFPNTTKIFFSLPESGNVRLVLQDMLGRQLRVIEDGFRDAGIYTVDINAQDLEAGVYLYQMYFTCGEKKYLQTKRMIVAR
ncbi:MAG: T9SS type A sorting domain-containing protein, partial [Bacteroidetes bacterium]|nr:T9SS type A sorting domain-containing protein [Bacteroidota bacterium]